MREENGGNNDDDGGNPTNARLLETFPLSEHELEKLLELEQFYRNNDDFTFSSYLADESHSSAVRRVEESVLTENLASSILIAALDQVFVLGAEQGDGDYELRKFLEAVVTCLGRRGPKATVDVLVHACSVDGETDDDKFRLWIYQLALSSHALYCDESDEEHARPFHAPAAWSSDNSVSHWATWTVPQAYTALSTFVHLALFADSVPFRQSTPPLLLPQLDKSSAILSKENGEELAVTLALMSPHLGGSWRRLYSSDEDACSFRVMQMALIAYKGPTVMLIRSKTGDIFGFGTDCPWKVSTKWYGEGSDSFLFTLYPKLAMYPSTGQGKHYMYLNLPPKHRPQDLRGMAFGGISCDRPRLHVTESLEGCRASAIDVTYQTGPILSDDMEAYFDVDVLEVWATCVEEESFERNARQGKLQVDIHEAHRRQVASVDKSQFVDDFASGAFMSKAFAHRNGVDGGRHEATIRDFKEEFDKPNQSQHGKE